jgi:SAM-dependent methyltransferase
MPRIGRTIFPRIRKSFEDRGVLITLARSVLLPFHLLREYRAARTLHREPQASEFDLAHGVSTEGDFDGWTYLSDLKIASPNWIHGNNYAAVEPERFRTVMAAVPADFREFTFVDFGSGKGRALLLASEYPFKKIVGLEFSRELHDAAVLNIEHYRSDTQKCRAIESLVMDFVEFDFPAEPLVLYFFDPSDERVIRRVMEKVERSVGESPRDVYVAYVGPRAFDLAQIAPFLEPVVRDAEKQFAVYLVGSETKPKFLP